MKKYVIVCVAVLLVSGATAFAEDLLPPVWRGLDGTTLQMWEFDTPDWELVPPNNVDGNPYGDPLLQVDTLLDWIPDDQERIGIWPLGELNIYLPNNLVPNDEKLMRIQLTWKPGDNNPSLFVPSMPAIAVVPFSDITMTVVESIPLGNDWETMVLDVVIRPNPPAEWITVEGDILVDELVIDTYCIPEPAAVILLAIGGLALYRRRRA